MRGHKSQLHSRQASISRPSRSCCQYRHKQGSGSRHTSRNRRPTPVTASIYCMCLRHPCSLMYRQAIFYKRWGSYNYTRRNLFKGSLLYEARPDRSPYTR
jgi:hypothetical protein